MKQLPLIKERRDHVAIMRSSWGLIEKIENGEKTIESRWYEHKSIPWDSIEKGDTIFFKNTGGPVVLKAEVKDILRFENLTPEKIKQIIDRYGGVGGLDVDEIKDFYELIKEKKYGILIFLEDAQKVEPFDIDKKGFGSMTAWLTTSNIDKIRKARQENFKQVSLLKKR